MFLRFIVEDIHITTQAAITKLTNNTQANSIIKVSGGPGECTYIIKDFQPISLFKSLLLGFLVNLICVVVPLILPLIIFLRNYHKKFKRKTFIYLFVMSIILLIITLIGMYVFRSKVIEAKIKLENQQQMIKKIQ